MLSSPLLSAVPGLRHAFFTREGGVSGGIYSALNGGLGSNDDPAHVAENRRRMAEHVGVAPERFISLHQIHFTNPEIEDKVDILSLRARGETDNLKPGAPDVLSRMMGQFSMRDGRLTFSRLEYVLPGGDVQLSGTYRLDADRNIYGVINGGGAKLDLRTFNGSIYIRKGK